MEPLWLYSPPPRGAAFTALVAKIALLLCKEIAFLLLRRNPPKPIYLNFSLAKADKKED
jgi:hypothetical protein